MGIWNTSLWNGGDASAELGVTNSNDIIYAALRALGVLRAGMTANSDSLNDGHVWLNDMVDAWNTERLTVPAVVRDTYTLVANRSSYTLGPGGDLAARPAKIEHAGIIPAGLTAETPLEVLTPQRWSGLSDKSLTGTPSAIYNENQHSLATLYLWPIPTSADTLALYTWQTLSAFADLTTQYAFSPGYVQALKFNLALTIAPMFIGASKIPTVLLDRIEREARASKARIKSRNAVRMEMSSDPAFAGGSFGYRVVSGRFV